MHDVRGHDEPKQRFLRTIQRGRLGSGYLLVGPRGVGKRLFAQRLAERLLCLDPAADTLDACGRCASCRLGAGGEHPDLLTVATPEGRTALPVELMIGPPEERHRTGLCHDVAVRPYAAPRRVAVIDDADAFTIEAANALLKTLEEPPPGVVMLLVGVSLARLLPTIRSRCQAVRFGPLSTDDVAAVLTGPPHALSPDAAAALAAASGGSVGRALELGDLELSDAADAVRGAIRGPIDPLRLSRLLEDLSKAGGTEPRLRRRVMGELIGAAVEEFASRARRSAEAGRPDDTALEAVEACLDAEEALGRNGNQSAVGQRLAERLAGLVG